jgi:O-antigen/teichoic acid export membrane protein
VSRSLPLAGYARRTWWIALGQGAVKANQLVVAVVLVHLLSPARWNEAAVMLSVYLAAATIGTLNLQHGIVFFLPRLDHDQRRSLVLQTAAVIGGVAIAIGAGLAVIAPHTVDGGGGGAGIGWVPWLALAVVLELPAACAPALLLAVDRLRAAAAWDVVATVVLLTCVTAAAVTTHRPEIVAAGIACSAAVRLAGFVLVVRRTLPGPRRSLPAGTLTAQVRYGIPLGLTIATSTLNRSVDKWFVAALHPSSVGVYAVAAQEVPLLAVLPYAGGAAVVTAMVDAFRRGDRSTALAGWLRQTSTMSWTVIPMSVALIVCAPEVLALVFGPAYRAGVLPFQIFTAITLHRVAEYGLVLRASGHTRELLRSALVLLAANSVLAGTGAAVGGMVGASLGTLIANVLAWAYVLGRISRVLDVPVARVFPWAAWAAAVGTSTVLGSLAWMVGDAFASGAPTRLAAKLAVLVGGSASAAAVARRHRLGPWRPDSPNREPDPMEGALRQGVVGSWR